MRMSQKEKTRMKLLIDKAFSLGTNKHVGLKSVIKRIIFIFASIIKCFEHRGNR